MALEEDAIAIAVPATSALQVSLARLKPLAILAMLLLVLQPSPALVPLPVKPDRLERCVLPTLLLFTFPWPPSLPLSSLRYLF